MRADGVACLAAIGHALRIARSLIDAAIVALERVHAQVEEQRGGLQVVVEEALARASCATSNGPMRTAVSSLSL
jgi:hypothetical protein